MNLPLVLPQPADTSPPPATPGSGAANAEALSGPERLVLAIDRADAMLARGRGTEPGGLSRLFCALCLTSGVNFQIRELATALPAGARLLDQGDIVAAMANLGYHAARVRPSLAALQPAELPLLFVPRRGAPGVIFTCPASAVPRILRTSGGSEPFAAQKGACWSFSRNEEHPLDRAQRTHTSNSWFRAILALFPRAVAALVMCSLAAAFTAILLPLFTIQTYAQVISLGSAEPLPGFIIGMMLVVAIELTLLNRRKAILAFVANRIEYLVGTLSFERLLRIRASVSERASVTDQAARLRTAENVRDFVTGPAFTSILEAPASLAAILLMALLAGWLAVVPALAILAHLVVFTLMRRRSRVMTSITADESTEMQRITIETFEKRDAIREAGLQHLWSERMVTFARRQQRAQMQLRMTSVAAEALSTFVLTVGTVVLLVAGANAVWAGMLGPGGLLAIVILGLRALNPFHTLCLSVGRFEQLRNSVQQINQLMEIPPEKDPDRAYVEVKSLRGAISFVNAAFRASDTRPVFVGLDIEIEPGEVIAITGANGSGKSTVLKFLLGLSDLSIGTVRIDGVDLRQLALDDLRRRIAYVPQQPRLFPGTLRQNLLFTRPMASTASLETALRQTGLSEAVAALPHGLEQELNAAEIADLPTEFVYKFAFARAFLTDSRVLLVDEIPNALLDGPVGELLRGILSTRTGLTILFVTHRSDFLQQARRVIALRYGKVPVVTTADRLLERAA
ncbi:MAG: type I secretion system permease/ATPase [Acuticoccus sp.]